LALKLAAMLEAEGWTTWRDTNLAAGDVRAGLKNLNETISGVSA
jgi:hypothetical protein